MSSEHFVETLVTELGQLHDRIRAEVTNLDDAALAWVPGPDTNSISTIVIHVLGSEAEVLKLAAGMPAVRDRAAEFTAPSESSDRLLERIRETDDLIRRLAPRLADADLSRSFVRPSAVRSREARSALFWLLNSYGHGREHLAQVQLTRQMHALKGEGAPKS